MDEVHLVSRLAEITSFLSLAEGPPPEALNQLVVYMRKRCSMANLNPWRTV